MFGMIWYVTIPGYTLTRLDKWTRCGNTWIWPSPERKLANSPWQRNTWHNLGIVYSNTGLDIIAAYRFAKKTRLTTDNNQVNNLTKINTTNKLHKTCQVATSQGSPCKQVFLSKYSWLKFTRAKLLDIHNVLNLPLHGRFQEMPVVSWICEHCLSKRLEK